MGLAKFIASFQNDGGQSHRFARSQDTGDKGAVGGWAKVAPKCAVPRLLQRPPLPCGYLPLVVLSSAVPFEC